MGPTNNRTRKGYAPKGHLCGSQQPTANLQPKRRRTGLEGRQIYQDCKKVATPKGKPRQEAVTPVINPPDRKRSETER